MGPAMAASECCSSTASRCTTALQREFKVCVHARSDRLYALLDQPSVEFKGCALQPLCNPIVRTRIQAATRGNEREVTVRCKRQVKDGAVVVERSRVAVRFKHRPAATLSISLTTVARSFFFLVCLLYIFCACKSNPVPTTV